MVVKITPRRPTDSSQSMTEMSHTPLDAVADASVAARHRAYSRRRSLSL